MRWIKSKWGSNETLVHSYPTIQSLFVWQGFVHSYYCYCDNTSHLGQIYNTSSRTTIYRTKSTSHSKTKRNIFVIKWWDVWLNWCWNHGNIPSDLFGQLQALQFIVFVRNLWTPYLNKWREVWLSLNLAKWAHAISNRMSLDQS